MKYSVADCCRMINNCAYLEIKVLHDLFCARVAQVFKTTDNDAVTGTVLKSVYAPSRPQMDNMEFDPKEEENLLYEN